MTYYEDRAFDDDSFSSLPPIKAFEFVNCTFELTDFSKVDLTLSKFIECSFLKCNFSNTNLKNAIFRDIKFNECKMLGLNWSLTQQLSTLNFDGCILDYSIFQNLKLIGVIFRNCSIREVDFYESNLTRAVFTASNLHKTIFNKANLSQADFRQALDYFIDLKETNVKKAKFSLPEALNLLRGLDIILE